jgi:hypothetical protein
LAEWWRRLRRLAQRRLAQRRLAEFLAELVSERGSPHADYRREG